MKVTPAQQRTTADHLSLEEARLQEAEYELKKVNRFIRRFRQRPACDRLRQHADRLSSLIRAGEANAAFHTAKCRLGG